MKKINSKKDFMLLMGIFCSLFITSTVGPSLFGVSTINTAQSVFVAIYFIQSFNSSKLSYRNNISEYRLLMLGVAATFVMLVQGASAIIDIKYTFFYFGFPVILMLSIKHASSSAKNKIVYLLYLFFFVECGLAIYEKISMVNVFPYGEGGGNSELLIAFRSTSLLGHPLVNANIVVMLYAFFIINSKTGWFFYLISAVTLLAVSSFNARGATMIFFLIFILYYVRDNILRGRYKFIHLLLIVMLAWFILVIFSQLDIAGRLFHGGELMDGSAQTRLYFLEQIKRLYFEDFFFGFPHRKELLYMQNGLLNESGFFVFIGYFGVPILLWYAYTYYKLFVYYLGCSSKFNMVLLLLSSFGISLFNQNIMKLDFIMFLVIALSAFSGYKNKAKE